MQPRVVDMYRGELVARDGFQQAAAAGVWGVIHKASQGTGWKDPAYDARRAAAIEAGLLWGAYHFADGSDVGRQADWFLSSATPDQNTLLALDFERYSTTMTAAGAVAFMREVEARSERTCVLYSGDLLKRSIEQLDPASVAYLTSRRLWLSEYGPVPNLPRGYSKYWLWQYTGDGYGPEPHYVPGVTVQSATGIDLSVYSGTREQLTFEWAGNQSVSVGQPGPDYADGAQGTLVGGA